MKKGWKIVLAICFAALMLGIILLGVGLLTGADLSRIFSTLDQRYHLTMYYEYFQEVYAALQAQL